MSNDKMHLTILVTFSVILVEAYGHGLCSWPCFWQNRVWYNNRYDWYLSAATSTYEISFNGTIVLRAECFKRYGPFIMIRFPEFNVHSCVKVVHYAEDLFILHGLAFPPGTPPDLCEFCSSIEVNDDSLTVWVDAELTELGCDTPKHCPSGYGDTPCTGCEKGVPDNGYCCDDKPEAYRESYTARPANKGYVKRPSKLGEKKSNGVYGYDQSKKLYSHTKAEKKSEGYMNGYHTYNPSNP